jgi:hypothetical protein
MFFLSPPSTTLNDLQPRTAWRHVACNIDEYLAGVVPKQACKTERNLASLSPFRV